MAMNVTPFVGTDNFNMETFNNMISQINGGVNSEISDVLAQLGTKAKFQTGSYVGTGTYGADNPCSLTFDFVPKVVYISQPTYIEVEASDGQHSIYPHFIQMVNVSPIGNGLFLQRKIGQYIAAQLNSVVSCSFNDKTVSWYNFVSSNSSIASDAILQMNNSGTTYYYMAIG